MAVTEKFRRKSDTAICMAVVVLPVPPFSFPTTIVWALALVLVIAAGATVTFIRFPPEPRESQAQCGHCRAECRKIRCGEVKRRRGKAVPCPHRRRRC